MALLADTGGRCTDWTRAGSARIGETDDNTTTIRASNSCKPGDLRECVRRRLMPHTRSGLLANGFADNGCGQPRMQLDHATVRDLRERACPTTTDWSGRPKPSPCPLHARSAGQRRELTVTSGQPDVSPHQRRGRLTRCANRPSKQWVAYAADPVRSCSSHAWRTTSVSSSMDRPHPAPHSSSTPYKLPSGKSIRLSEYPDRQTTR
jgi:hypothetical protein